MAWSSLTVRGIREVGVLVGATVLAVVGTTTAQATTVPVGGGGTVARVTMSRSGNTLRFVFILSSERQFQLMRIGGYVSRIGGSQAQQVKYGTHDCSERYGVPISTCSVTVTVEDVPGSETYTALVDGEGNATYGSTGLYISHGPNTVSVTCNDPGVYNGIDCGAPLTYRG